MKKNFKNYVSIMPEDLYEISHANKQIIDLIIEKSSCWKDRDSVITVALGSMLASLDCKNVTLNDNDMKIAASIMKNDSNSISIHHAVKRSLLYYSGFLKEIMDGSNSKKPKVKKIKKNK